MKTGSKYPGRSNILGPEPQQRRLFAATTLRVVSCRDPPAPGNRSDPNQVCRLVEPTMLLSCGKVYIPIRRDVMLPSCDRDSPQHLQVQPRALPVFKLSRAVTLSATRVKKGSFADMFGSAGYQGIYRVMRLNDNQSTITVPILDLL